MRHQYIGGRLEHALDGRSIQWLANEMTARAVKGSGYASVYRYVKGEVVPALGWLEVAAVVLGAEYAWLVVGDTDERRSGLERRRVADRRTP